MLFFVLPYPCYGFLLIISKLLHEIFATDISAAEVSRFAKNFHTACSCVIKIVEPRACAAIEDLKAAVLKMNSLEEERNIPPWDDEHIPEEIVISMPDPG